MILIITLNPLLEKRYFVEKLEISKTHRVEKYKFSAGGKGINVGRELNKLGLENLSIVPIGGNTGKIYRHTIENEKISFSAISVKSELRTGTVIVEKGKRVTSFIEPGFPLSSDDISKIKEKINKMIENASTVVFAGSVPNKESAEIICSGINWANQLDKVTLLDTYGTHLKSCVKSSPMIIHNNIEEVSKSLNIPLKKEKEVLDYLKSLYESGVKIAVLTDGENPAYALKFGYYYKIYPPKITEIDSTGSGDSFVAGLIYGLEKDLVFSETLRIATALGTLNAATISVSTVEKDDCDKLVPLVKIEEIGDKMKVIDDSPRY